MIRSLVTIGMIAGFIACGFSSPIDARSSVFSLTKTNAPHIALQKASAYWSQIKNESKSKVLLDSIKDIEWAVRKHDVRLCSSLPGDYLALCLALVTEDASRCAQIDVSSASGLRKLCTEELAT